MNILIITDKEVLPTSGGIERVSYNFYEQFRKIGYNVILTVVGANYAELLKNNFDVIICNLMNKHNIKSELPKLFQLKQKYDTKLLYCYHNTVGYELLIHTKIMQLIKKLKLECIVKNKIKAKLKCGMYADKIVLLSESYIPIYQRFINFYDNSKFVAIPNSLSFNLNNEDSILNEKRKEVLIVTRFDDKQKRIILALQIWKKIEESKKFGDWILRIVGGGGKDELKIKQFAKKQQLKNVIFVGRQKPESYYRTASIFMMTSAFEGFPMTLGEAQQFGAVPIVFNTFSAVFDIIENDQNGIIIENNNLNLYCEELKNLMLNADKREKMAIACLESCQRFSEEKVIAQWEKLFRF